MPSSVSTSTQKDHKMIKLITDVMSNPRVQESIIGMLESRLKMMNVKFATHLVLMGMQRTSFGSDDDVLEDMFETWEPLLSTVISLVGPRSLAKICLVHAAVERSANQAQKETLRLLTKKVLEGLPDRAMARKLAKGLMAAKHGNRRYVMRALLRQEDPIDEESDVPSDTNGDAETDEKQPEVIPHHPKEVKVEEIKPAQTNEEPTIKGSDVSVDNVDNKDGMETNSQEDAKDAEIDAREATENEATADAREQPAIMLRANEKQPNKSGE